MIVADSSGWIEYFRNGPRASVFAPPVEEPDGLLVPCIAIYEVSRRLWTQDADFAGMDRVRYVGAG